MPRDEDFDADSSSPAKGGGNKFNAKVVIPIIIVLVLVVFVLIQMDVFTNMSTEQMMVKKGATVLVIGAPSPYLLTELTNVENKDLVSQVRVLTPQDLRYNPNAILKQYDIIILDQTMSSSQAVTRQLANAIKDQVMWGKDLIVVGNSGIYREGANGLIDVSVIGWKGNFGNLVPVGCDNTTFGVPSCLDAMNVNGRIIAMNADHPIMLGIQKVPALDINPPLKATVYPVQIEGKEIAMFQDIKGVVYPGIVEKTFLLGKVIYFNYDPGLAPAVFENTLNYLQ